MNRRIPQTFIDELIARADIVEILGHRITLKRAGREYKALCPFHDEKTPSFTVSPTKGFYHCFGCGAHGTAIGFLMAYDNLEFPEAVGVLAEMLGLEVPTAAEESGTDRLEQLTQLLREADQIYRRALRETQPAIEYLKHRGIEGGTAARFAMGYAPDAWDTLLAGLGTSPARIDALLEAGLLIAGDQGRRYDRFRDRIMFPIRDHRGRIIGFGGRALGNGEPKYLNSPETPLFHKGNALYGLYEARQLRGRPEQILVVEGYLDVASLAQAGIEPVVATLGTATTAEHVRRLTRLADRVIFCFDGDRAGRAAAWRALETALPFGGGRVELKFLLLPEGEDPDSLVRKRGADAFRALIDEAVSLPDFMVTELSHRVDLRSVDGRSRLVTLAQPLLARLPAGVYRELLLAQLASLVGLPSARLQALIEGGSAQSAAAAPPRPANRPSRGAPTAGRPSLIRRTIGLALHFPAAAAEVEPPEGLALVDQPGADLLRRLLEVAKSTPHISTAGLLERFRDDPEGRHLGRLVGSPSLDDEEIAPQILSDSLARIVEDYRRARFSALLARREALSPEERAELEGLSRGAPARDRPPPRQ